MVKLIRRNWKRRIEEIFEKGVNGKEYSLDNHFIPTDVSMEWIKKEYNEFKFTRLIEHDNEDEKYYIVQIHSRLWYKFYTT